MGRLTTLNIPFLAAQHPPIGNIRYGINLRAAAIKRRYFYSDPERTTAPEVEIAEKDIPGDTSQVIPENVQRLPLTLLHPFISGLKLFEQLLVLMHVQESVK